MRIVRESTFERFCRESLVEKKKAEDDTKDDGVYRFQRELAEANAAIINFARWACWADAMGNSDIARPTASNKIIDISVLPESQQDLIIDNYV